jgi:hypothetical protein
MSKSRDELDAALRARFDPDDLAVYADLLQSEGDPRGELITLELQTAVTPEIVERRRALLKSWLGDMPVVEEVLLKFRYGFIEDMQLDGSSGYAWLASPAGEFLRTGWMYGKRIEVERALVALAARPRPWLTKLALEERWDDYEITVPPDLVAATPNLVTLELVGPFALEVFAHPKIERIVWTMGRTQGRGELRMPSLTTLELSTRPPRYEGEQQFDVFAWLAEQPIRLQLRHVRLPRPESPKIVEELAAAMPACQIEIR